MNHLTRQFIEKYDREHPGFASRYCQVADLYDADLDIFQIELLEQALKGGNQ